MRVFDFYSTARPQVLLQETSQPRPDTLLGLAEFAGLGLLVQNLQRVGVALLLEVLLDFAEFLAELAVQDLWCNVERSLLSPRASQDIPGCTRCP